MLLMINDLFLSKTYIYVRKFTKQCTNSNTQGVHFYAACLPVLANLPLTVFTNTLCTFT